VGLLGRLFAYLRLTKEKNASEWDPRRGRRQRMGRRLRRRTMPDVSRGRRHVPGVL